MVQLTDAALAIRSSHQKERKGKHQKSYMPELCLLFKGTLEIPQHLMYHYPPQAINEARYLAAQVKPEENKSGIDTERQVVVSAPLLVASVHEYEKAARHSWTGAQVLKKTIASSYSLAVFTLLQH